VKLRKMKAAVEAMFQTFPDADADTTIDGEVLVIPPGWDALIPAQENMLRARGWEKHRLGGWVLEL
jgi:hypothetical protein